MFELTSIDSSIPIWKLYRSYTLGKPVLIEQAYNATYPWIEFNGIYFHRSLEFAIQCFINGCQPPLFLEKEYNTVLYAIERIKNDSALYVSKYAMVAPINNNTKRIAMLQKFKNVCIIGNTGISISGWHASVYTDYFKLGGDYVLSTEECVLLSRKMPLVCKPEVITLPLFSNANWNNVWVLGD